MWLFRRSETLEPLTVKYEPPPDGSYPPRLLNPLSSIWSKLNDTLVLDKQLSLQCGNGEMTLIPTDDGAGKVQVNGQPLYQRHTLQDGDFVQIGHDTFIFQSDPVVDRKRRMVALLEKQNLTVTPSGWLRERIDLNATGLSLDKRKTYILWDEIVSLVFSFRESWPWGWSGHIAVHQFSVATPMKLRLTVKKRDLLDLIDWFRLVIPFDLSVYDPQDHYGGNIRTLLPDAYHAAVIEKILQPAQEGKRTLPGSHDVISGFASVKQTGLVLAWGCLGIVVLLLVVGVATGDDPLRNLGLIGAGFLAIMLWQPHKQRLEQWLQDRKKQSG